MARAVVSWADEMDAELPAVYENMGSPTDGVFYHSQTRRESEQWALPAEIPDTPNTFQQISRNYLSGLIAATSAVEEIHQGPQPPAYTSIDHEDAEADTDAAACDYVMARRLDREHQGDLETTRMHRSAALRSAVVPDPDGSRWLSEKPLDRLSSLRPGNSTVQYGCPLYGGAPYGAGTSGASWTDAHLKMQDTATANSISKILRTMRTKERSVFTDTWSVHTLDKQARPDTVTIQVIGPAHREAGVYIQFAGEHDQFDIIDWYMSADLRQLERHCPEVAQGVRYVLATLAILVVDGTYRLPSILHLHDSGLKEMKKFVRRTQHGSMMTEASPTVAHVLVDAPVELGDAALGKFMDFSYWSRGHGVHHGRLRAADVPPAGLILLGANGGLSTSGHAIVIRNVSTRRVNVVASSATAGMSYQAMLVEKKHGPCVRDGLMSPIACAALHGTTGDMLSVTADGVQYGMDTFLKDADDGGLVVLPTADMCGTRAAIEDIGALTGYQTQPGTQPDAITLSKPGKLVTVVMLYCIGQPTRWECLLSRAARADINATLKDNYHDSELGIDYGASALGRVLLRPVTSSGILQAKRIRVARKGRFSHLSYEEGGKRVIAAPTVTIVNYVIDTEYATVKRGSDILTYVYALGIAKFCGGRYLGSTSFMDTEANVNAFLATLRGTERQLHGTAVEALRALDIYEADMVEMLGNIRSKLVGKPGVRVYAKGREAEERLLASSVEGGTRLFRRQAAAAGPIIRELGALLPKYDLLARDVGWTSTHDPAREAVLFGFVSGLCVDLPPENIVGSDIPGSLMPEAPGVMM